VLAADSDLISVNDHLVEQPDLWAARLPQKLASYGPRVVQREGRQCWVLGEEVLDLAALGLRNMDDDQPARRFSRVDPAVHEPVARIEAMDRDGVTVHTLAPTVIGFAGERLRHLRDPELWSAAVTAYNDFLLDEFCAVATERLIAAAVLPLFDPQQSAHEAARALAKGARALLFPHDPASLGLPSLYTRAWDELFATAEEAGTPLMVHIGTGGRAHPGAEIRAPGSKLTLANLDCLQAITEFVFSGALLEHRRLQVVAVEAGAAWLPYLAERMDFFLKRPGVWSSSELKPSDLLRAQVSVSFIDDPVAIRWRHDVGVDRLLWQSDFPHRDSFWPESRAALERLLADVPDDEATAIAATNACRLLYATDG